VVKEFRFLIVTPMRATPLRVGQLGAVAGILVITQPEGTFAIEVTQPVTEAPTAYAGEMLTAADSGDPRREQAPKWTQTRKSKQRNELGNCIFQLFL
jgi:hypothetical protein